jgi:hypothetical protein
VGKTIATITSPNGTRAKRSPIGLPAERLLRDLDDIAEGFEPLELFFIELFSEIDVVEGFAERFVGIDLAGRRKGLGRRLQGLEKDLSVEVASNGEAQEMEDGGRDVEDVRILEHDSLFESGSRHE